MCLFFRFNTFLTEESCVCPAEEHNIIVVNWISNTQKKSQGNRNLNCIEEVFSIPSFLILVANLSICFCILSLYLHITEWKVIHLSMYFEWALYAFNSSGCLFLIIWTAAEVPIKERKFKEVFHQKAQSRIFSSETPEDFRIERWLLDKPDFVFTGVNIVSYRRSTIFAVMGTLITYTVLVVNK
ncbi:uncharacterized protein NPIL_96671 [Nephila pilipes]|uniref:Uncharacterized protein n=1 Tax=Nephila pilipes TaxID=299642 RepID=A0A8X6TRU1_NEPPI|nr:uncharacterized protein NPIL_96671 [Nephila pilipes]